MHLNVFGRALVTNDLMTLHFMGGWSALTTEYHTYEYVRADRIEELEAKLAKAMEAIEFWSQAQEPEIDAAINLMQSTLAELKGDSDD
jgi:hypothetical protein